MHCVWRMQVSTCLIQSCVSADLGQCGTVIVLPVCSPNKWTVTRIGGCISVGRFVRVSVWSTSTVWQHLFCYVGGYWLSPSPHLTSKKTNHVTTEHQGHKTDEMVCIPSYQVFVFMSVIMARKQFCFFPPYTAEAWIATLLLPHLATLMPVLGL